MAHESSSRKRHRNAKLKTATLIATSCCAFAAGSLALGFVLNDAAARATATENGASPPNSKVEVQEGANTQLAAEETPSSAESADSSTGAKSGELMDISEDLVQEGSSRDSVKAASKNEGKKSGKAKADAEEGRGNNKEKAKSVSTMASSKEAAPRQSTARPASKKTLHHSAFTKTPVYCTLRHLASRQVKTASDGTCITWAPCPVCGKRHKKSYTEKAIDHYRYKYCKVCGKKHEHAFTEVVSN